MSTIIIDNDIPLGNNIRKARNAKGMTQEQLITCLQLKGSSMSRSTLANIESGLRNIHSLDLVYIAEILDVSIAEFFAR